MEHKVKNLEHFIYGLIDPRTSEIKYIGRSKNPEKRKDDHLIEKRNPLKLEWIKELIAEKLKPTLIILEKCSYKKSSIRERFWIKKFKGRLLNRMVNHNSKILKKRKAVPPLEKKTEFKKIRKQLNLSQAQLADKLGCHLMGVSMKERGVTPVSKIDMLALRYLLETGK